MSKELRIWVAVRRDLNMPAGKMAAQVAHAATSAVWLGEPSVTRAYMDNSQAKIVVSVADEKELFAVYAVAIDAGLPAHLVTDAGLTVFNGPTPTVVSIGPAVRESLPAKVRRLRLWAQ